MGGDYHDLRSETISSGDVSQDSLYQEAADTYGSSLDRSFANFDRRCSVRTWVNRVAHNVATGPVIRQRRVRTWLVSIENIETMPGSDRGGLAVSRNEGLERLSMLIQRLKPLGRQIIVSYLEDMDASSIGEITGCQRTKYAVRQALTVLERALIFPTLGILIWLGATVAVRETIPGNRRRAAPIPAGSRQLGTAGCICGPVPRLPDRPLRIPRDRLPGRGPARRDSGGPRELAASTAGL